MRAAVLEKWEEIRVKDVPKPTIDEGECLIKISYTGVCGSDVHIFSGTNPIAVTPVIQGHEFVGTVAGFEGKPQEPLTIGQSVAVHPLVSCGQCHPCRHGIPHVCETLKVIGVNRDGGFSEYARVPLEKVIPIADGIPDRIAALTEPFAVGYHASQRAGIKAGETVLIVGGGPIGLMAGIVLRILGASDVVFTEPMAGRRAHLEQHGFDAFDPLDSSCGAELKQRSDGSGFDIVFEASGSAAGVEFAQELVRVQGRIISLGFSAKKTVPFNIKQIILKENTVLGSRVYPLDEFRNTLRLIEAAFRDGTIDFDNIISDVRGLEDVEQSIRAVARGEENGKILIRPE